MQEFIDDELDDNLDDVEPIVDNPAELYEHFRVVVDKGQKQIRVDKYLFERLVNSSRNRIQKAADAGFVMANGKPVKSSYKVKPNDVLTLMLDRPRYENDIIPEDIPLDIVYEDDDLMVINKPAGLVVHPGCGNYHGTLVNAIAWHLKDNPKYDPNDPQVGLVHRIIINSDDNYRSCSMVISIAGEDKDTTLRFEPINKNYRVTGRNMDTLSDFDLVRGKNYIDIKFEDNDYHSLNIKAYEN